MEGGFLKAYVLSYKRDSGMQNERYVILEVEGVDSKGSAARLIGKKVVWMDLNKKLEISGKIVRVHGNRGKVIAKFDNPLPGQAIGTAAAVYLL
ncbi:MAG: 50S ribosomal protein L35ae [Thermofilaceae archaeon]